VIWHKQQNPLGNSFLTTSRTSEASAVRSNGVQQNSYNVFFTNATLSHFPFGKILKVYFFANEPWYLHDALQSMAEFPK